MKPFDITGERFGNLIAIELIPENERKNKRNVREWLCKCDCGNTVIVEQRNLRGKKYQQQSCGCLQSKAHLVKTSKIPISLDYVLQFDDFKKFAFLHKCFVKCNLTNTDFNFYNQFINKFYYDKQFNLLYKIWNTDEYKANKNNTYYNWHKPSIDHIIPKSKGGKEDISNYQFLTVFENLCKRDMTMNEWEQFLKETDTQSDLFINTILKKEGLDFDKQ
jgi:hypothetical protein